MLRDGDVEAAVDAGIITAGQARAMAGIAAGRRKARRYVLGGEERFRLIGGFNDVFIAIGVLLLGIGLLYGAAIVVGPGRAGDTARASSVVASLASWFTVGVLVMWGLAEYLTGRLRLVAPSILVVLFLALLASAAASSWYGLLVLPNHAMGTRQQPGFWASGGWVMVSTIAPLAMVCVHYLRFRLPFSLFVIAASAVFFAIAFYLAVVVGPPRGVEPTAARQLKWVIFGLGLAVFAWAMTFDMSDPERTSRRSDCGFWLHLLAAPLIVHPLAGPLINHPLFPDYRQVGAATTSGAGLVFPLVAALSFVALVVDRRALLVAGLGYLGAAMAYSLAQLGGGLPSGLTTLLGLGVLIIVLGVGWRGIRGALMRVLPAFPLKSGLPPYDVPA